MRGIPARSALGIAPVSNFAVEDLVYAFWGLGLGLEVLFFFSLVFGVWGLGFGVQGV